MKNRKLLLIVSLVLALTMSLGGTLAYLTDTDGDINVMTLGNVKIVQNEQERVEIGNAAAGLQAFTDGQMMLPAVYELVDTDGNKIADPAREEVDVNGYKITYGGGMRTFPNYMDKIVTVTNTGNSDAWVRTLIAVPVAPNESDDDNNVSEQWLHYNCVSDTDTTPANGWYYGKSKDAGEYPSNYADHYIVKNVTINGAVYDVTVATNVNPVEPGETTGPNLVGLYLDNDVDYKDGKYYGKSATDGKPVVVWEQPELKVLVLTQAVQTTGFDDPFVAFKNSFGDVTVEEAETWFSELEVGSPGEKNETNNPPRVIKVSTSDELQAALATKTEGDEKVTVLMLNDIDATVEADGNSFGKITGNIILDMDGHTLNDKSGEVQVVLYALNGGKLTITGNGKVYSENHNKWMIGAAAGGEVVIENGTFVKAPYVWGKDCGYDGCTGGVSHISNAQKLNPLIWGSGVITVYDGYFDCGILNPDYVEEVSRPVVHDCMYPTINLNIDAGDDHVVIYGGTFVTANPVDGDDNPRGGDNSGNANATEKAFFLYGQEEYGVLPAGYTITEGKTDDGRTTYTVNYSK